MQTIYFNVEDGKQCSDYHVDNSLTGYNGTDEDKTTVNQTNCLKFYKYAEDKNSYVMILDHNLGSAA